MDCFQPAGSFKLRGMGYICQQAVLAGKSYLICSSGGNAGFATAYAGRMLGVAVTIVVPQTTVESVRQKIMSQGAKLIVHGTVWDEAHQFALGLSERLDGAYIHPFDDPKSWDAHATMIDEVVQQCPKPDLVILSVGGAGLLCGVIEGLHRNGWQDVPVVAVETEGAASLAATLKAGKLVTLPQINSIASTLGAKRVTAKALEWSKQHSIIPTTVTDAQAVEACRLFADHHRALYSRTRLRCRPSRRLPKRRCHPKRTIDPRHCLWWGRN